MANVFNTFYAYAFYVNYQLGKLCFPMKKIWWNENFWVKIYRNDKVIANAIFKMSVFLPRLNKDQMV